VNSLPYIRAEDVAGLLDWSTITGALEAGHRRPRADLGDLLLQRGEDSILNRAAWIDGLGIALKSMTIFPGNPRRQPPQPSIQGAMLLFDDHSGAPLALIDGALVTHWKTAGDSMLGARLLARPEARRLLIVGAGVVASSLIAAWRDTFPCIEQIRLWNRNRARAEALAAEQAALGVDVEVVDDLAAAAAEAELISCATMATEPLLRGEWIAPGTHVDLIGAFRPDMREADDALLQKAELFVDSRETTLEDIGELKIPLASGAISEADVRGDFYDLCNAALGVDLGAQPDSLPGRSSEDAITVFKNGGGAHLDLMTANMIYAAWSR